MTLPDGRITPNFRAVCACAAVAVAGLLASSAGVADEPRPGTIRQLPFKAEHPTMAICPLTFSPSGKELLSCGLGGIRAWDVSTGKQLRSAELRPEGVVASLVHACEGKVVVGKGDAGHTLMAFDAATLKPQRKLPLGSLVYSLAAFPRGNLVAAGLRGKIVLVDASTMKVVRAIAENPDTNMDNLAVSPDGKVVASATRPYGTRPRLGLRLYDCATGKLLLCLDAPHTQQGEPKEPFRVAFSNGTGLLAAGVWGYSLVGFWQTAQTKPLRTIDWTWQRPPRYFKDDEPTTGMSWVLFSADGKTILVGCNDGKLRMWEAATGKLRHLVELQPGYAVLSPDGAILATATEQIAIRLWDWRDIGASKVKVTVGSVPRLWDVLASDDAGAAFGAVSSLICDPKASVRALGDHLKLVEQKRPAEDIGRLVAQLGDEVPKVREAAQARLAELGRSAEPALRAALKSRPSAELRISAMRLLSQMEATGATRRRHQRAVEVLEAAGTPEARRLLERLSKEAEAADLSEEAGAALKRLSTNK